jgi:hypothetical protein
MSYHVTILRTERGKQVSITQREVERVIAMRGDLVARPTPDGELEISILAKGERSPLLIWHDGAIWTRDPDDETLQLMLDLAAALGARVRGDENETYRTISETYSHPDDAGDVEAASRYVKQARRRRWIMQMALFAFFLLLALAYGYCSRRH